MFDGTKVDVHLAKKGFESFEDAVDLGRITKWKLSKVLRDPHLFKNTDFKNFDETLELIID